MMKIKNKKIDKKFKNININTIETIYFNKQADQWWKPDGAFKPLHRINLMRLDYILTHSNGLYGKTVLDVGCGGGLLSESMTKAGAKVVGLDISINTLKIAKSHALSQNLIIDYILETIEEHSLNHLNHYDVITCMELLEHVPDPLSIINSCNSIIKIGGSVFFSTINRTLKAWLLVIIGAEYILKIIPKGTHQFQKFITPSELLNWIDQTNLKETHISGIYYNPILNKCSLTKNIETNYIIHTKRY